MESISLRMTEEELRKVDAKASEANLKRSEYIRRNLFNNSVQVINKGRYFYQSLCAIEQAVSQIEQNSPNADCSKIREEIMKACQLLL